MTLEQEYLRLAVRKFEHLPLCYSRQFALDSDKSGKHWRIRCARCHNCFDLPPLEIDWKAAWSVVFGHVGAEVGPDGSGVGVPAASVIRNGNGR